MIATLVYACFLTYVVSAVSVADSVPDSCSSLIENTNPFLGSAGLGYGYGSVSPAASYPQGPLRLGPDTTTVADLGFQHFSGYLHGDKMVRMFSHTRFVGAGINGLGAFGVMPMRRTRNKLADTDTDTDTDRDSQTPTLEEQLEEDLTSVELERFQSQSQFQSQSLERDRQRREHNDRDRDIGGDMDKEHKEHKEHHHAKTHLWWSKYNPDSEVAHAGYYSVELDTPNVKAEMLATSRLTATHKYSYLKQDDTKTNTNTDTDTDSDTVPAIVLDFMHSTHLEDELKGEYNATLTVSADGRSFTAGVFGHEKYWTYIYGEIETNTDSPSSSSSSSSSSSKEKEKEKEKLEGEGEETGEEKRDRVHWITCGHGRGDGIKDKEVHCDLNLQESGRTYSSDGGILLSHLSFGGSSHSHLNSLNSLNSLESDQQLDIYINVALSFVSTDHAKKNFYAQVSSSTNGKIIQDNIGFQDAIQAAKNSWCKELDFIDFKPIAGDTQTVPMLTTSVMRSRMTPAVYSETDGLYMGFDGQVHNVISERTSNEVNVTTTGDNNDNNDKTDTAQTFFFSDFSLWDVFRTQLPWLLLSNENTAIAILRSFAEITQQQDAFPKWTTGSIDNGCMIGVPGAAMVLEACLAGFKGQFNLDIIQRALQKQATQSTAKNGRKDIDFYLQHGYVSSEEVPKGSSDTLHYAYDDYILAGISDALGREEDANAAAERSLNYKNIFDIDRQLMCPKSQNGTLTCDEYPTRDFDHYVEGDALHWTYFVPHDIPGLKKLYPSNEAFDSGLEKFFEKHIPFHETYGAVLPNPYFWAGNEITFLTPFLFNYGSQCYKTQYWSRKVTDMHFSNTPSGLPGNDDYASMSTWVLFASLGVYPLAGTDTFTFGSPRISQSSITLKKLDGSNSVLRVIAYDNNEQNVYIQRLLVNGKDWNSAFIKREILVAPEGCKLEFFMSSEETSALC